MMSAFDDRVVTLDAPEQLSTLGSVLGSRTRLAVLAALLRAGQPLHINELARRVGVDASPVRTHLELLLKERLVREVDSASGRERRFETSLTSVRVVLENVDRPPLPAAPAQTPKEVERIMKKVEALGKDMAKLEEKARRYQEEIKAAYAKAQKRAAGRAALKG